MPAPILITGFHRSGTSAVARVLHQAGLDLGSNLLGAEPSNPYGHFEDLHVIDLHDAALASHGLTWKSPTECPRPAGSLTSDIRQFVEARERTSSRVIPWGIKDPRLCLFLNEWLAAIPDANVIVVLRQPGAAIDSLHRRHAQRVVDTSGSDPTDRAFWEDPDLGLRLWIHYHEQLLRSLPRSALLVDFSDRASIEQLPTTLQQRWGFPASSSEVLQLDPALGASPRAPIEVRDPSLIESARQTWDKLLISCRGTQDRT